LRAPPVCRTFLPRRLLTLLCPCVCVCVCVCLHARACVTCSVINFVLIIFLSWTFFISLFPHSTLCLLVGIVVGFIELPFCCWCIPQCNQLAQFMSPLKIYWIRGCGYLFMALLLFAAYWGTGGGILMVIFSLMLTADGVCYVLAHFKGESETQESGYDTLGARTCSRRTQCP
jgi:hypothetical protein